MRFLMAAAVIATATLAPLQVFAQTQPSPPPDAPRAAPATAVSAEWRASKLVGLDVYNAGNQKVGDIDEVLIGHDGKVAGFVVGVGGFLGMGEHDVLIAMDGIRFVNEPVKSSGSSNTAGDRHKWYPDHAVINATKDQLKAMPQFKYD